MARQFTLSRTDRGSDASAPAERAHGAGGEGNFSEPMNDDPAGFRQWLAADRVVRAPNGELVNSFEPLPRERTQPEEIGLHVRRIASTATGCVSGTSLKETQNKDAIGYLAAVVGKPLAFEKLRSTVLDKIGPRCRRGRKLICSFGRRSTDPHKTQRLLRPKIPLGGRSTFARRPTRSWASSGKFKRHESKKRTPSSRSRLNCVTSRRPRRQGA